ncbi:methylated-DNA--[protein]-cysteine S-methyltransferase [Alteribacillus sp. YIM 98480]|uniref:methylated-DNA--[protein]-cysteine S-methyltransferase n=1 Tax=Alteribacillus sp. YIM 98480 TaxID=2606599 RepID=UPI00131AC978|nr:methylated-DNA--[protein]-cysteine S-methyltransferase [Alteribacillus sp. YIM 98480]
MPGGKFIYYANYSSAIGPLTLAATDNGICSLQFGETKNVLPIINAWMRKQNISGQLIEDKAALNEAMVQLEEYFTHKRKIFDLHLDLYGTPFQKLVWEALQHIPYGETRSYKQIAADIGAPKAVRAIGSANNKNPLPIFLPCHRVIGSNGNMVGYGGGLDKKMYLLQIEGALEKISS